MRVTVRPRSRAGWASLSLNHLISAHENRLGNGDSKGFSGLEVHHHLEFAWLLDWQVTGLGAFQNLVHIAGRATEQIAVVWPIGHQPARFGNFPLPINAR